MNIHYLVTLLPMKSQVKLHSPQNNFKQIFNVAAKLKAYTLFDLGALAHKKMSFQNNFKRLGLCWIFFFYYAFVFLFLHFKTSPHLFKMLKRMLQRCLSDKRGALSERVNRGAAVMDCMRKIIYFSNIKAC